MCKRSHEISLQVSIKFISNLDNFAAEQRFYGRLSSDGSSAHLGAFVPHLHDAIVGCSSTTWSGEHHPPALVLERGHFSLAVSHFLLLLLPLLLVLHPCILDTPYHRYPCLLHHHSSL